MQSPIPAPQENLKTQKFEGKSVCFSTLRSNSAAHYPAADVPGLIELAEQVGFGAFWKGESNSTDPIVMLSAVASRTKKINQARPSIISMAVAR